MARTSGEETIVLKKYLELPSEPLWNIKQSNLGGRGLFASQFIEKGSLIFTNKALVVGPRGNRAGEAYCSICYKISDLCYSCEKCASFICSEECKKSREHEKVCHFITTNWKLKRGCDEQPNLLKYGQIYLRFLLLAEEQKEILSIMQTCNIKSEVDEIRKLCSNYVVPEEQIQYMELAHTILKINSFRIADDGQNKIIPLRGLYPLSAFLNHSCVPNTRNVFGKDLTMDIYATKDIQIGEEIVTCYTGLLWCTPARRCQLFKTKHFWCKCERCEDRTEMGTNLSALKCLNKECVGVLLPISSLEPGSEWLCDNCRSKTSASKISTIQSVLGSLVGTLDLDDQFRLDTPVLSRLANFIPNTNHVFIDIRLRLAMKIGYKEELKLNGI